MAQIDIGKTAFAGFGLVRRKPLAVVGWGVFLFVVGFLPALAMIGPMAGAFGEFIHMAEANQEPDPEKMMALMMPMQAMQPILWLTGLITRVMLTAAIFRAVLDPKDSSWAYLRVGMGEVMVAIVAIVLGIVVGFGVCIAAALVFAVSAAVWQASHAAAVGTGIILGLGLLLATIWVLLRLSLAVPMSFAEKNFRLFESWRVTKGNSLRLLLVALINVIILMIVEGILAGVMMAVILPVVGISHQAGGLSEEAIKAFFSQPVGAWLPKAAPWILGIGLIGSIVGAALVAVVTAPWAEAYRQLRKTPDALV